MPPTTSPLFRLLTPLLSRSTNGALLAKLPTGFQTSLPYVFATSTLRGFSTTPTPQAPPAKNQRIKTDPRITLIRYHLQHPATPRPLRLSRMRALRHWTIHRAWMLVRRKRLEAEEKELLRFVALFHIISFVGFGDCNLDLCGWTSEMGNGLGTSGSSKEETGTHIG